MQLLELAVPAAVGGGLYVVLIWSMRLPEFGMVAGKVMGRLKR